MNIYDENVRVSLILRLRLDGEKKTGEMIVKRVYAYPDRPLRKTPNKHFFFQTIFPRFFVWLNFYFFMFFFRQ